jgi:glycerol uptake facilitator-like aquaporin
MAPFDLPRRLTAEFLGSLLLAAVVIGSGVMGQTLAGGNVAIALIANTLATGAGLTVLIVVFGPVSGAHFNPAVSLVAALNRELGWRYAALYALVQVAGCIAGAWTAHLMFGLPVLQVSAHLRDGPAQVFSETVATFGLVATILACVRLRPVLTPACVGLYIAAAYWFTASTSFANPAITLARSLSDSFAGVAPQSVPGFLAGQIAGALAAWALFGWLLKPAATIS